jgi:hypothetical protein
MSEDYHFEMIQMELMEKDCGCVEEEMKMKREG